MEKKRVLFVCVHNSARSQMAEALLNKLGGDRFQSESAGLEPGVLNPLAVKAMEELGIDISGNTTKSILGMARSGRRFDIVVTVCDESDSGRCPVFPGNVQRLHWSFPDPSSFRGTDEERLEQTRRVRDQIRASIERWIKQETNGGSE